MTSLAIVCDTLLNEEIFYHIEIVPKKTLFGVSFIPEVNETESVGEMSGGHCDYTLDEKKINIPEFFEGWGEENEHYHTVSMASY